MTTILAIENRGRVHIGSDSQASTSWSKTAIKGGKINTVGPYTFGVAGLFEMIERLKRAEWPEFAGGDAERHVVDIVLPWMLETQSKMFEDFGIDESSDNPFHRVPRSSVLLAFRGQVFPLHLEKGVSPLFRHDGKYAIGSGAEIAGGAMRATPKRSEAVVLSALRAAALDDLYTSGPFVVKTVR